MMADHDKDYKENFEQSDGKQLKVKGEWMKQKKVFTEWSGNRD